MDTVLNWQQALWQTIMRDGGIRGHALLLKGREGIGKFAFARLLAKSLLCKKPAVNRMACGQCSSCNWFDQQTHPNFSVLLPETFLDEHFKTVSDDGAHQLPADNKAKKKPSQHIGINQIRELDDFVYLSGHQSGHKIVLIYPAETMNNAASNALLKKLEEPPELVLFILVSHQPQRLLPTVRSRCQQIAMPVPDSEAASQWLKQQTVDDQPLGQSSQKTVPSQQVESEKLLTLLALASYAPFKALQFAENYDQHQQFINHLSKPESFDPLAVADMLKNQDLSMTVGWMQKWCYDVLSFSTTGSVRYHPHCKTNIQAISSRVNPQIMLIYQQFLNKHQSLAQHTLQARLFLEEMLIRYRALLMA